MKTRVKTGRHLESELSEIIAVPFTFTHSDRWQGFSNTTWSQMGTFPSSNSDLITRTLPTEVGHTLSPISIDSAICALTVRQKRDNKKGINRFFSSVVNNDFQDIKPNQFTGSYKFILNRYEDELSSLQYQAVADAVEKELPQIKELDLKLLFRIHYYSILISEIPFKKISFEYLDNSIQFNLILNNKGADEYLFLISIPSIQQDNDTIIYSFFINRELEVSNVKPFEEVIKGIKELLAA